MKKSLMILTLAILQCACPTQDASQSTASDLLGFAVISAEIRIDCQETDATDDLSRAVASSNAERGSKPGPY